MCDEEQGAEGRGRGKGQGDWNNGAGVQGQGDRFGDRDEGAEFRGGGARPKLRKKGQGVQKIGYHLHTPPAPNPVWRLQPVPDLRQPPCTQSRE